MNEVKESIIDVLRKIDFVNRYKVLCLDHEDFENRINLKRSDVEEIIKSYNLDFKYVANDRTFLREFTYKKYIVRFFIGFKGGIIDFSYLIWEEGIVGDFYKGRLASLAEMVDSEFQQNVKYKTPIASSVEGFKIILKEIFNLYKDFEFYFYNRIQEVKYS